MPKHGNLDVEKLIKAEIDNFGLRSLVLPICVTGCYTDGWGWRGKAAVSSYQVQSLNEPRFVPPILELCCGMMS